MNEQSRLTGRLTSHWVRVDGQEIHYLRSTGPEPPCATPVVLLHGIIAGYSFARVAELLAPHHRVYIPDLPGVGKTPKPEKIPELADLEASLIGWMDACGLSRVHLAGQSFGCNLAVESAATHPKRVASVTLQALTMEPERRTLPRLAGTWLLAELREFPRGRTKKAGQHNVSIAATRAMVKALLHHRLEDRLPLVRCPSLIIHGTDDHIVSRQWAESAAQLLPDAHLELIPRATHTMNARQPEAYADAWLRFIGSRFSEQTHTDGGSHAA